MKSIKSRFSILEIGNFEFYSGIFLGLGYSIILNILFQQIAKLRNITTAIREGNWKEFLYSHLTQFDSLIISTFSVSLAFCFTTYLWMSSLKEKDRKKNFKLKIARTNSIFIFGLVLFVLTRYSTIYSGFNYDNFDLSIKQYFGLWIFIFPTFIYLYNWSFISKIYKSKKGFIITTLICLVLSIILSTIKT